MLRWISRCRSVLKERIKIIYSHGRIEILEELVKLITKADTIVVLTHTAPDGDALGSALALGLAFEYLGKKTTVYLEEPVPRMLNFLCGQHLITYGEAQACDLVVCVDTSDMKRLGKGSSIYSSASKKIVIDHHTTNDMEADGLWIDKKAAAAGEMVYYLIKEMKVMLNHDIAVNLYTAVATDTGGFRYSNTRPQSHIIAADLLVFDIPFAAISKKVFDTVSYSKMSLIKKAVQNLTLYCDGKIAVSWLLNEDINSVNAQPDDFEGLVNMGRNLEGVEVSLFLREEKLFSFKGSLRANDYVDVAVISGIFSGGGHKRAAGFSIEGSLQDNIKRVVAEIEKVL